MAIIQGILKYFIIFGISAFILINLIILFTGRLYIYKGLGATYFRGNSRPSIYDQDVFHNRTVEKGNPLPWEIHPKMDQIALSKSQRRYLEELNTSSFLVVWGDSIIFEEYWNEHNVKRKGNAFSATKSLVALLIGCAVDDGFIHSIDDPVAKYLDEFKGDKSNITIRHMLTMSTGLSWSENYWHPFCDVAELYYDTDARDLVLNRRKIESEPGKVYDYKSGDTQTLMYILRQATQKHMSYYASEKIWSKIGAESDAFWSLVDGEDSEEKAYCCLYATTRDFAKLGKLVNQNGQWQGKQIISSAFVEEFKALAPLAKTNGKPNQLYGFQQWIYTGMPYDVTYSRGMAGQYIISIPEFDLSIVRTGNGEHKLWENTSNKKDDALEGHRIELPAYVSIAMTLLAQIKNK